MTDIEWGMNGLINDFAVFQNRFRINLKFTFKNMNCTIQSEYNKTNLQKFLPLFYTTPK